MILAGSVYTESVANEIFATLRVPVAAQAVFPTTDLVRLERTATDTYQVSLFPGRSDRGLQILVNSSGVTLTSVSASMSFVTGGQFTVPALITWPGSATCRLGADVNSANGTLTFGASATAPNGDYATGTTELRGMTAQTTAATNLVGGLVRIKAGDGAASSAGLATGGNVTLDAGQGFGTGKDGNVIVGGTRGSLVIAKALATNAAAPTLASALTIAPTAPITFVSGVIAITTITAPSPISAGGGMIILIPTGLWTTATTGNIALVTTAVVSKALILTYDTTTAKWYPSY